MSFHNSTCIWFSHLDSLVLDASSIRLAKRCIRGGAHWTFLISRYPPGLCSYYGIKFRIYTLVLQASQYTSWFFFFVVSNSLPFILHHFFLGRKPKGTAIRKRIPSLPSPFQWKWIIQSVHRRKASSASKERQPLSQVDSVFIVLSLLLFFFPSKLNLMEDKSIHTKKEKKIRLIFTKRKFCFVFFGSETQVFPNQVKWVPDVDSFQMKNTPPSSQAELCLRKTVIAMSDTREFLQRVCPSLWRGRGMCWWRAGVFLPPWGEERRDSG